MTPEQFKAIERRVAYHTYSLKGINEMYPECACGEAPPCTYKDDVTALLAEVKRLSEERDRALDALVPGNRDILLIKLTDAEADRDLARDAAVALEQENARLTERIAAATKRARTRDEDLLHMRDNSKNAQRTMSRGHAWEVAAYEVRTIADLLDGGDL